MKKFVLFLIFLLLSFTEVFPQKIESHLAVNVPFRNGEEVSMRIVFPLLDELGVKFYRHMMYADVIWTVVEMTDDNWDFVYTDSSFFNSYGITPLATLYSYTTGHDTLGMQVPWKACFSTGCGWHFSDSLLAKDYVTTVVNRYKSVTKYWEISNELDGHQRPPRGLRAADVTPFLKMNYRWIKALDPNAKILQPSLSGTYGMPLGEYGWLKRILHDGACPYFDILGYHDYNSWWTLPAHIDSIRKAFQEFGCTEKPMWVTECSISSDPTTNITPRYSSIDGQAADTWRRAAVLFASGVDKMFWHPFWSGGHRPWIEFGLVDARGKKKKSFYSYQLLIQEIDTFSTAEKISFGKVTNDNLNGGDGVWCVKFNFTNGENKWVAWSPNNESMTLQMPQFNLAEVTQIVPVYISSDGETAKFARDTIAIVNGTLSLSLNDFPILIKGLNITNVKETTKLNKFRLCQNYPNPFNPTTTIKYSVPSSISSESIVKLEVYNTLGQKIATLVNKPQSPGNYSVTFDASDQANGIYFFTLRVDNFIETKKMVLLK